tara:strand:+ start:412 stop:1464 length:1053 start_codon:yes stop_codon:yes gene_type:complete
MNIAVFACANGLGHTRRVIAISNFMFKRGFSGKLTAFISKVHIDHMANWNECKYFVNHANIKIIDFCYPTTPNRKINSIYGKNWSKIKLPPLKEYDIVWSDNITQVVEKRNDTILTGSFLWYDVFAKNPKKNNIYNEFIIKQRDIVRSIRPVMIASEYFATPEVRFFTNFEPVGLYRYDISYDISLREKIKKDILFSCGLGGEEENVAKEAIAQIIKNFPDPGLKLWVEPRILPEEYPKWIQKADFSKEMYQSCIAAIIRPGIGTISDVLANRGRVFTFYNDNIFEMGHNASVLEQMGLGEICVNPYDAFKKAILYINDNNKINQQIYLTSHLRMDGILATAELITGRIT